MTGRIAIVGLGPGDARWLTRAAWERLSTATEIYARTKEHPALAALPDKVRVHTFDAVYAQAATFEEVYETITRRVVGLAQEGREVIYAVPGHPRVGEATTPRIEALARDAGIPVEVLEGISFVDAVCNAVGLDPLEGLTVYDAMLVAGQHFPKVNTDQPLLLGQLYSRDLASDVKLTLLTAYPPEHRVTLVRGAGTDNVQVDTMPLHELDRHTRFDHMTTLVVPPWPHASAYETFQEIVHHLRSPEGCPWDRKQTHQSLRRYLLEEAYEVLEALDRDDPDALKEELGDLLLQIALHVAIAGEGGEFLLGDVIGYISDKMIRRHPHVFGDVHVEGAEEVVRNWEAIKRAERQANGEEDDPFAGVPRALPALTRAGTVAKRGHWSAPEPPRGVDATALTHLSPEAFGDLLFWLAAWARQQDWDAEMLLREATERFIDRVRAARRT